MARLCRPSTPPSPAPLCRHRQLLLLLGRSCRRHEPPPQEEPLCLLQKTANSFAVVATKTAPIHALPTLLCVITSRRDRLLLCFSSKDEKSNNTDPVRLLLLLRVLLVFSDDSNHKLARATPHHVIGFCSCFSSSFEDEDRGLDGFSRRVDGSTDFSEDLPFRMKPSFVCRKGTFSPLVSPNTETALDRNVTSV